LTTALVVGVDPGAILGGEGVDATVGGRVEVVGASVVVVGASVVGVTGRPSSCNPAVAACNRWAAPCTTPPPHPAAMIAIATTAVRTGRPAPSRRLIAPTPRFLVRGGHDRPRPLGDRSDVSALAILGISTRGLCATPHRLARRQGLTPVRRTRLQRLGVPSRAGISKSGPATASRWRPRHSRPRRPSPIDHDGTTRRGPTRGLAQMSHRTPTKNS
jgi:hypothetical protein